MATPTIQIGIVPVIEADPAAGVVKVFIAEEPGAGIVPVKFIDAEDVEIELLPDQFYSQGVTPVEIVDEMAVGVVPVFDTEA